MAASSDDHHFDEIYRSIPVGLTVVAAKLDHFETLRSFCYSLKAAGIRQGSNAMFFLWQYSKRSWLTRGHGHFRSFVEKHRANGARLFMIDQPTGWVDVEVAKLIREFAEAENVRVLLTEIADPPRKGAMKRTAILMDRNIEFSTRSAIRLSCRTVPQVKRSDLRIPVESGSSTMAGPERRRNALRDLAERPGTAAEGRAAKKALARFDALHRRNPPDAESDWFRRLVIEHNETIQVDDVYSATTIFGGRDKYFGHLYFMQKCPQPIQSLAEAPADSDQRRSGSAFLKWLNPFARA